MDLQQLGAEVKKFGIDFRFDGDPAKLGDDQREYRKYRAALYLRHLRDISTYLTTALDKPTAQGGLGGAYSFCKTALQSPSLVGDLASEFDRWVTPAVLAGLDAVPEDADPPAYTPAGYKKYFNDSILNATDATWDTKVTNFLTAHPITKHALDKIAANFTQNIKLACGRVSADLGAIEKLFSDDSQSVSLTSLKEIKSTGSDFHKGGQQVLILTFGAKWWFKPPYSPVSVPYSWSDLKLVYKPADVEADCLLVGDSAAVNRAVQPDPKFMAQSLTEIFNAKVATLNDPELETLPTYRILPRKPTSSQNQPRIREAYGYIQYLGYDLGGTSITARGYYPFGYSDYLIFPNQQEEPIAQKFYRQLGEWIALSSTFSLTDLHMENVRAYRYQPYLIDLEIALTVPMNHVQDTCLFYGGKAPSGGINGEEGEGPSNWRAYVQQGPLQLNRSQGVKKRLQNRLWRPGGKIVDIRFKDLSLGVRKGMSVLRACQQTGDFQQWFARLSNVLVRLIPYATPEWLGLRRTIYSDAAQASPPVQLAPTIAETLLARFTTDFGNYQKKQTAQPDFMVMDPAVVPGATGDLDDFDIPTFYHRIGTAEILSSNGAVLPVPAMVTVQPGDPPPVQVDTKIGRQTFFAAPPTTAVVEKIQVENLKSRFESRTGGLVNDVRVAIRAAQLPQNLSAIIPPRQGT